MPNKWRPAGFKNPYDEKDWDCHDIRNCVGIVNGKKVLVSIGELRTLHDDWEECADAMLEALRKQYYARVANNTIISLNQPLENKDSGTLVFIPDDKE